MKKVIQVRLDPQSIADAIKEIEAYKKRIEMKVRLLVQRLSAYGAEVARVKIVDLGAYATGALLSGVSGYYSPALNAGFVHVTSDHVAFVEFGTGVKGNGTYPNAEYLAKASWGYVTGGDKNAIFTTKDGRVGWMFPLPDGSYRFTEGLTSRPFMYETVLQLQRDFPRIVKEVFST